jgi:CheY-like chemotaxis protein
LLSDVVLPGGINGRELAEQFRREKPGLRVVLTSGYGLEARLRALPPLPHLRLLPKPYLPSLLAQTIRDCLDERW